MNNKGFSLIELMVAMAIALLAMIAITNLFLKSDNEGRAAISNGQAQQSSGISLYQIERNIASAGYGITAGVLNTVAARCSNNANVYTPVKVYRRSNLSSFNFWLAPVVIVNGVNGSPDTIRTFQGDGSSFASLGSVSSSNASSITTTSGRSYGFLRGDLILLMETGRGCMVSEVTANDGIAVLSRVNGVYFSDYAKSNKTAEFNKTNGMISEDWPNQHVFTSNAKILNIGNRPYTVNYSIVNNNLIQDDTLFFAGVNDAIASNVVDMQAQYGIDTNNDGSVDIYRDAPPNGIPFPDSNNDGVVNEVDVSLIKAIRLAVLVISDKKESTCDTAAPSWSGGAFNLAGVSDWACYKYKKSESVISIRNMVWDPK